MEAERIEGKQVMDDEGDDHAPKLVSSGTLDLLGIGDQRLARIQEYEDQALRRPDAYAAMSGFQSATCSRILEHYSTAVMEELESYPHSLEDLERVKSHIRDLLKLKNAVEFDGEFAYVEGEVASGAVSGTKRKALVHRRRNG